MVYCQKRGPGISCLLHTSLSGARSRASSSALFLRVWSAPSFRRATAVSPRELMSDGFTLWAVVEVSTNHDPLQLHDEGGYNPRCQ